MSTIVFSHGNSFPASTYRVMLDSLRARGFEVHAIEKYGHDPKYPVTDNWPHLVRQLAQFATQRSKDDHGGAPWLVGHSLGGLLSLMCAARHPELARGVVMIDSPVLSGWRAGAVRVVKRTPLMRRLSPSSVARRRRKEWDDRNRAMAENVCAAARQSGPGTVVVIVGYEHRYALRPAIARRCPGLRLREFWEKR